MAADTAFDYYYGDESNQFSFYRIPRQLITGDRFKRLSTDAKLLDTGGSELRPWESGQAPIRAGRGKWFWPD